MDQRSKCKSKIIKLLEENKREKLHDIGFGNDFLDIKQKHRKQKKKQTNWTSQKLNTFVYQTTLLIE